MNNKSTRKLTTKNSNLVVKLEKNGLTSHFNIIRMSVNATQF